MMTLPTTTTRLAAASALLLALCPVAAPAQDGAGPTALRAHPHDDVVAFEQSYVIAAAVVRARPSSRARVVNRLRRGQFVNLGECVGTWCRVDAQGGNGWVAGRLIGRGRNPYDAYAPADPGIPPQEPGTRHDGDALPID